MSQKCKKCHGELEPIHRMGKVLFWFCRARTCKIPYDDTGAMLIETGTLASSLNPLSRLREVSSKMAPGLSVPARAALEALLLGFMLDNYQAGVKDGILLTLDRDFVDDEPPVAPSTPTQ